MELRVPPPPSLLPYSPNVKLTARLSALAVRKIGWYGDWYFQDYPPALMGGGIVNSHLTKIIKLSEKRPMEHLVGPEKKTLEDNLVQLKRRVYWPWTV